ncbi:hypothetical protein scyTo_0002344 [Scyliorhinus torazame]|uniref:Uncharacterized protein n=1 Tax=Scyliorhinus torazame TaxID=75743 RepID=A0A401PJ14_SCYTO|nr:hypothetical protein [Scyliorhinus torazame]
MSSYNPKHKLKTTVRFVVHSGARVDDVRRSSRGNATLRFRKNKTVTISRRGLRRDEAFQTFKSSPQMKGKATKIFGEEQDCACTEGTSKKRGRSTIQTIYSSLLNPSSEKDATKDLSRCLRSQEKMLLCTF